MEIGIHGDNRATWPAESYLYLKAAQPDFVKMMTWNSLETFREVKEILPDANVVTRIYYKGLLPSPDHFVGDSHSVIRGIMAFGYDTFELLNEPNNPVEGHGLTPGQFNDWAIRAIAHLRKTHSGIKILWPALAINPGYRDVEWWTKCKESIEACDGIAAHAFWQPEWAMTSPQWGLRFVFPMEMYPDKPLWITEVGCTDPNVSKEERCRLYPLYCEILRERGYKVEGLAFWMVSGTDEWEKDQNAHFDLAMCRALRGIPRDARYEFILGFAAMAKLFDVGEPLENEWHDHKGRAWQLTTEGVLFWQPGQSCQFFN